MPDYIKEQALLSNRHKCDENQDYCFCMTCDDAPASRTKISVLCVMDGVSQANGGQAVRMAARALRPALAAILGDACGLLEMDERSRAHEIRNALIGAICDADRYLREQRQFGVKYGTTISLAVVFDGAVYTANVGDSPIYMLKFPEAQEKPPSIVPLFACQNRAGVELAQGRITEEEALASPGRNELVHMVGGNGLRDGDIFTTSTWLGQSNILMLGSDGALAVFSPQVLLDIVKDFQREGLSATLQKVFDAVKQTDSTDNFTILAQWLETN